jgi:hypothetical protein
MRWALLLLMMAAPSMAWSQTMRAAPCMRDLAMHQPREDAASSTLTIDAMPYARTVTCGSYTLTGSASGAGAVSWSASPSGASGACTGTTSWSCVVSVAPDAAGEGVETITVSRGSASDDVTIGFYVAGSHSCFLAQDTDGDYNATMADLDPVSTWSNYGTSGLDVSQATGTAQPTFRTGIVGGQPVVRFDGGDYLLASTASDWTFLHNGSTWSVEAVAKRDDTTTRVIIGNNTSGTSCALSSIGSFCFRFESTNTLRSLQTNAVGGTASATTTATMGTTTFNLLRGGVTSSDVFAQVNANAETTATKLASPTLTATGALGVGAHPGVSGTALLDGDVFRVVIYQSALTATQRGINQAVDEWALGGTLPVTP